MYDLIIIGSGPGGYCAAEYAAKHGMRVAIFEAADLGGVCLNWGCIPTKGLLHAAEQFVHVKNAAEFGINVGNVSLDLAKMIEQSRSTVAKLGSGISFLLKKVEVIKSYAKLGKTAVDGVEVIDATGKIYKAKHVMLATGSKQRGLPGVPFSDRIWDVKRALTPKTLPKKMAIIGAGAIGMEFANFYALLGVSVTVFEMAPKILAGVDAEAAQFLQKKMQKLGIKFVVGQANKVSEKQKSVEIEVNQTKEEFDCAIVAIGVIPNVEDFGAIEKKGSHFKTNQNHETNIKNVFAIGDCAAPPWLAHKATAEGLRVIDHILQRRKLGALPVVPMCIYTHPQIASVGKSEEELKSAHGNDFGKKVKIGRAHFYGNGKAVAIHEADGFVKVMISSDTHEILGVHMVGANTTEMIHSAALAIESEAIADNIIYTIFPHPTMSEILHEAFMDAIGH